MGRAWCSHRSSRLTSLNMIGFSECIERGPETRLTTGRVRGQANRVVDTMDARPINLPTLLDAFLMQDRSIPRNAQLAIEEFGLIDQALSNGLELIARVNDPDVFHSRSAQPEDAHASETVTINLLTSAIYTLVSSTRLTLSGNHVDALTLLRSAFEASYYAEYFRHNPSEALKWDSIGKIEDLRERQKFVEEHFRHVRNNLEGRDDPDRTRTRFYRELSSYGPHPTPAVVAARMSSDHASTGIANLGFVSTGKINATRLCASHTLHILMYALSEFFDACDHYPAVDLLKVRHNELRSNWLALSARTPTALSLLT